jgi:hypothetical protein
MPLAVIVYSRVSGSWRLARVLRTVSARRRVAYSRMYSSRTTLSARCEMPCLLDLNIAGRLDGLGAAEIIRASRPRL